MPKVTTFTSDVAIFKTAGQLEQLDEKVNVYIETNNIKQLHSVSDTSVTNDHGSTIGVIRVIAYD